MKRIITASSVNALLESSDGMFKLIEQQGENMGGQLYKSLEVISSGLAEKHVVGIRLYSNWPTDEEAAEVTYTYYPNGTNIVHGMRSTRDTLEDTAEYIDVLESALQFADEINAWLRRHREWLAKQ